MLQIRGSCVAKHEAAREVLSRIIYFPREDRVSSGFEGRRIAFVWRLFYGIDSEDYHLNVLPASEIVPSRFGGMDMREILLPASK